MATLDLLVPLTSSGGGVTVVSSGNSWLPNLQGVYTLYGTNDTSFDIRRGIYVEPQATNYCTNYNAAPDVSLTGVSTSGGTLTRELDVAKLASGGLANICSTGYVFKLVNTTGSPQTVTITGSTGGVLPVAISAFARATGKFSMQLSLGEGLNEWAGTAEYRRIQEGDVIPGSTSTFQFIVPDGVTLRWVLNVYEAAAAGSNWGPTSPIVVAGSTVLRGRTYAYYDLPSGLDDDDVLVMADFKPASDWQYGNSAVAVASNGGTNRFDMSLPRSRMINAGGGGSFETRLIYGTAQQRLGLNWNSSGTFCFNNGQKGGNSHANPGPADLSSSRVHFGADRFGTATTGYAGYVRNFSFYSSIANDAEAADLTILEDEPTVHTNIGSPFYGQDGKLWCLLWNGTHFDRIAFSENDAASWSVYATLSTPVNTNPTLTRTVDGNFFIAGSGQLYRITPAKVQTAVLTWPTSAGTPSFTWLQWAWGEQTDGTLYTAPYNTSADVGNGWFFKSTDSGATWTTYNVTDFFAGETNTRHIHAIRVSPVDDKIYVCYGDTDRGTFVSDDAFSTATLMTGASTSDGPTDISFAVDGTLFFTDVVGNTNYIDRQTGDTTINVKRLSPRNVHTAPIYGGRTRGTEMVTYHRNENSGSSNKNTMLISWNIEDGKDGLMSVQKVLQTADPLLGETESTQLATDQYGQIPSWATSVFLVGLAGTPTVYQYSNAFNVPAGSSGGDGYLPSGKSRRHRNARYRYLRGQ